MAYFDHQRENGDEVAEKVPAKVQASNFLDGAARGRVEMEGIEQARLRRARDSGGLAKNTTDDAINNYAKRVGFSAQANDIVNNPPSRDVMTFLKKKVNDAQHRKGATYTDKYGDLRGTSAAKQRGDNTRLSNPTSTNEMDTQLAQKMKEAASEFDPNQLQVATQASLQQLAVDHFDPNQVAAATQASLHAVSNASFNANLRPTMNGYGISPPHALTPFSTQKLAYEPPPIDDTPSEIVEVRDEAFEEIMLDSESTRGETLQGVVDGLTRPRDEQLVKANSLLLRKGMSKDERLDGLAKFEDNRRTSKKN